MLLTCSRSVLYTMQKTLLQFTPALFETSSLFIFQYQQKKHMGVVSDDYFEHGGQAGREGKRHEVKDLRMARFLYILMCTQVM